jgi:hypothetical protein
MRIISRSQLMEMPKGTLYCKFEPCIFGDLHLKGDTIVNLAGKNADWWTTTLDELDCDDSGQSYDMQMTMYNNSNVSYPINFDDNERDGMYDDKATYMVWELCDLKAFKAILDTVCIPAAEMIEARGR